MGVKKDYLNAALNTILSINPKLNKDDVSAIISRMMKTQLSDPFVNLDNNVTGLNNNVNLTELCNWIDDKNPIVSGNATFYVQPEVLQSPTSHMLKTMKGERGRVKRDMYEASTIGDVDESRSLDLTQSNLKVIMNAEYGASGAPMAAFYTKYSPAATTLMAQSIITTMAAFFEGFVGDNMRYYGINECLDWMNIIRKKDKNIPKWIVVPTVIETISRIRSHFYMYDVRDEHVLESYISNCNDMELTYIFYANNIQEFIRRHSKMQNILRDILTVLPNYDATENGYNAYKDRFKTLGEYQKWISEEMFLNPYSIPDVILKQITMLTTTLKQFCYVRYLTPDSITKLNYRKRNTVLLVDTDSNVINSDRFVKFVLDEIFQGESFSRDRLYSDMTSVNILAAILDVCIIDILDHYCDCHNIMGIARKELAMKNEFMFRVLFLMITKKRYTASIALREGNIMVPFGIEIKGMDFIKAGVSNEVTERFTKMLETHILLADKLELHELMNDLKDFEKEIFINLKKGGIQYLKPQTYKAMGAYKEVNTYNKTTGITKTRSQAWSLPVFRAATVWNEIYPSDKIYSLDKIKLIKLTVTGLGDLEKFKLKYPKEYKLIKNNIFGSNNPEIVDAGLKVIALPSTYMKIPEWIVDLIDYDVVISDVMSSFKSVLDALGIEGINMNTPNGKANLVSSLISI